MKVKELVHAPKSCGGKFISCFTDDNVPFLKCDKCDHIMDDWIKWEQTYSSHFKDESKWLEKKHAMVCLLGLFCSLYEKQYSMKYSLSLSEKGLFNGAEMALLRRISKMLDNDVSLTREYIEWIFVKKVQGKKKKITSLSFMCVPDFVQEFKFARKKAQILTRDTLLPKKMLEWVDHFVPEIKEHVSLRDFNDLNILLTHYKNGHLISVSEVTSFVSKLKETGYIDETLRLKNWSANA